MTEIYDFFDSKSICEYNRSKGTHFMPIDKAVIISGSRTTTALEKLEGWRTILETASDLELKIIASPTKNLSERTNRQLIEDAIRNYEKALSLRDKTEGYVFCASLFESDFPKERNYSYFSSYEKAVQSIAEEKQHYLDNEDLQNVLTEAVICIRKLDSEDETESFDLCFDNDMRLIRIENCAEKHLIRLDDFFIYVPMPFERGNFVRTIGTNRTQYGIAEITPSPASYPHALGRNDMRIPVTFFIENGIIEAYTEQVDYLSL